MIPTILVVDDEPDVEALITQRFRRAIREKEMVFLFAHDGLHALSVLEEHPEIDLVLSDINMPKLDGYKLCKFVKKHARTKHIPVVLLSGKDGVFDKMRGKMAGCNGYLTKPFESGELIQQVLQYLAAAGV